jgi:FkbM family methyltransferase
MSGQFGEDAIVADIFKDRDTSRSWYLDIGASHPIQYSNTYELYRAGWWGITVEPCRRMYEEQRKVRPRDIAFHGAISDHNGKATFYECEETTVSTLDPVQATERAAAGQQITEYTVQVRTVKQLLLDFYYRIIIRPTPDLLSIDVEGGEAAVLRGCPFSEGWRPRVIIAESCVPCTDIPCHDEWEHILTDSGYNYLTTCGVNRIYQAT